MAKYLEEDKIKELIEIRNRIFPVRQSAYQKFQIDVLDNDTLSSLSIWEIVREYDKDYNTNFSRNGEDATSKSGIIEQKCSNVKPTKKGIGPAKFQFHAMGEIEYPRYIFVVRSKDTLSPVRMYDISKKNNTQIIIDHLLNERDNWLEKGKIDPVKNMKRDVIVLPEILLKQKIKFQYTDINGCMVFRD